MDWLAGASWGGAKAPAGHTMELLREQSQLTVLIPSPSHLPALIANRRASHVRRADDGSDLPPRRTISVTRCAREQRTSKSYSSRKRNRNVASVLESTTSISPTVTVISLSVAIFEGLGVGGLHFNTPVIVEFKRWSRYAAWPVQHVGSVPASG